MVSREAELIIVGAGPAGLSTGLHLAQQAPHLVGRTLILEREHHPRPKLCAGGVLASAEACLLNLGLEMDAVPSVPVREMHLLFDGRRSIIRREPYVFRTVRRDQFDSWLADSARERGLTLLEGIRVLGVQVQEGRDQVLVETDQGVYRARAVVGADGSTGVVRRAVQRGSASEVARLLEIRIPAVPQVSPEGVALFDFSWMLDGMQGYVWDFPSPSQGEAMRTWGAYDSRVHARFSKGSLRPILEEGLARHGYPEGDYRLAGHPLRWFSGRAALAAPHILLVGDAAGTDPVVGEGISFALGYGQVAAAAVVDALERDDLTFADYRQRVMQHRVGRYLRRRWLAARLLYGIRSRPLMRLIWPIIGWAAGAFFIDWSWGADE